MHKQSPVGEGSKLPARDIHKQEVVRESNDEMAEFEEMYASMRKTIPHPFEEMYASMRKTIPQKLASSDIQFGENNTCAMQQTAVFHAKEQNKESLIADTLDGYNDKVCSSVYVLVFGLFLLFVEGWCVALPVHGTTETRI